MLPEYSLAEPGPCILTMSNNGLLEAVWPTGKALSKGRTAGLIHVGVVCCPVPAGQSGRARAAALGGDSMNGEVVLCLSVSMPPKKNSLSLTSGPPTDPPN